MGGGLENGCERFGGGPETEGGGDGGGDDGGGDDEGGVGEASVT